MNLTPENKAIIDAYSVEELLRGLRFKPIGDIWFEGETGTYWMDRLTKKRSENNAEYVAASKRIGWER